MTCDMPSFVALHLSLVRAQHRCAPITEVHPIEERFDE